MQSSYTESQFLFRIDDDVNILYRMHSVLWVKDEWFGFTDSVTFGGEQVQCR